MTLAPVIACGVRIYGAILQAVLVRCSLSPAVHASALEFEAIVSLAGQAHKT